MMMPDRQKIYRPAPFNFVDLEAKASAYLAQVQEQSLQLAEAARNEIAKIHEDSKMEREQVRLEVEQARKNARQEAETLRTQLDTLREKLQTEETNFSKRKEQLEAEAVKLKLQIKQSEDTARKDGFEEGKKLGYDEGHSKGYADGELQAQVDYADRLQREAELQIATKLETLFPAVSSVVEQLAAAKEAFFQRWENSAVQVAVSIAAKAVKQQLPLMPEVPLNLLREALELGTGSVSLRIRLNRDDYEAMQGQAEVLVKEIMRAVPAEIIADDSVSPGGCILETGYGIIDNRPETRIGRIQEELMIAND
ncbi:flagellar assembly protein FliH [Planctomycetales bacterium]|nr:flagellar assembly protein FliH [Planctomycetales bacterium]